MFSPWRRGSRVETYVPLQDLMVHLLQQQGTLEQQQLEGGEDGCVKEGAEPFLHMQLPEQVRWANAPPGYTGIVSESMVNFVD